MRIIPYILLAYLMLGLQIGMSPFTAFHGASPNLALLAVLFIALNAPRDAALIGCFCIGLLQDLLTVQQPGLYAFSYGIFAMLVVALHQSVNRTHPLTHFVLALVGGLLTAFVLIVHSWIHPAAGPLVVDGKVLLRAARIPASIEFTRAVYTAVLAPLVLWALEKIRGLFAFQPGKRKR
jgi:rod shape-determining protein MreD